jgi:hypothetical protein
MHVLAAISSPVIVLLTYQPVTAFVILVRHQIRENSLSRVILSCLDGVRKLIQLLDSVGLE